MTALKDPFLCELQNIIVDNRPEWLEEFRTFLSFPSISSEANHRNDMQDCLEWLVAFLKKIDFDIEIWPTSGNPVLFASNLKAGPDQPTLLIYNHYDVQPVDPIELWHTPPFEATIKNNAVYARGAQDNKGQCFYVINALKWLMEKEGKFPINIKLCIEGDEEIGSPGLSKILPEKREALKADYLAIVDLGLQDPNIPALTLGTRGIITMDLAVQTASTDLHSGSHGGLSHNAIHVLTTLLATLRDEKGAVLVPGFYDRVKEIDKEERSALSFDFDAQAYFKSTGAHPYGGEKGFEAMERAWLRPTLEINGIHGGYAGTGFKTVIPAKAHAKISCRLVPDQDPIKIGEQIAKFLKEKAPEGVGIEVTVHAGRGKPVRISPKARVVQMFAKSYEAVFGKKCQFILEGASIPIVPELTEACGGEVIMLGLGLVTDQIHAPNEHFGIDRLEKGMLIIAKAIELLQADK